jgi:hypothetical protein
LSTANAASTGGNGGASFTNLSSAVSFAGGIAGTANSLTTGQDGSPPSIIPFEFFNGNAGGGGAAVFSGTTTGSPTMPGGNGGPSSLGGGGGGSGASVNGSNSGRGGVGGDGILIVVGNS